MAVSPVPCHVRSTGARIRAIIGSLIESFDIGSAAVMPGCAVLLLLMWMVPLLPWAGAALAQDLNPQGAMVRVVILSRHGLRGPTQSIETLNSWRNTKTPGWPDFGVPPGYLTPKGEKLVEETGA